MRQAWRPDTLGIGLSYFSALAPIVRQRPDLIDLIELEPQTLWAPAPDGGFQVDWRHITAIRDLGKPVLLHGVNNPVGGSVRPDAADAELFAHTAELLDCPWVSEHLSFNRVDRGGRAEFAGFMLPPLQTADGVDECVASISWLADRLARPLAVETGVNYLKADPSQMDDGAFTAAVTRKADCGILLDLHNLWTNQRNGRQRIDDFLSQLPLERVWEIHLAGGNERNGFWLDSHAGALPEPLWRVLEDLLPRLPSLGAMVFEIFPVNLPAFGIDRLIAQLERMRELWMGAKGQLRSEPKFSPELVVTGERSTSVTPAEWERSLVSAILNPKQAAGSAVADRNQPALALLSTLIQEFRAAMVVQNFQLTATLLFLSIGPDGFRALLRRHAQDHGPKAFAVEEALAFADTLAQCAPDVPYLREVLAFERATVQTLLDGRRRLVSFSADPLVVLRRLGEGQIPPRLPAGNYEVEITPEDGPGLPERSVAALH
ncbi:MAG: DUF692 domain-containing protein [Wenzhouxiangella sp.]